MKIAVTIEDLAFHGADEAKLKEIGDFLDSEIAQEQNRAMRSGSLQECAEHILELEDLKIKKLLNDMEKAKYSHRGDGILDFVRPRTKRRKEKRGKK
jgi:hypothetical protein